MIDLSTHIIELETQGHTHIIDITNKVQETLSKEGYEEGQVLITAMGSTAGYTCPITYMASKVGLSLPPWGSSVMAKAEAP